jgi:hypothetical protein
MHFSVVLVHIPHALNRPNATSYVDNVEKSMLRISVEPTKGSHLYNVNSIVYEEHSFLSCVLCGFLPSCLRSCHQNQEVLFPATVCDTRSQLLRETFKLKISCNFEDQLRVYKVMHLSTYFLPIFHTAGKNMA